MTSFLFILSIVLTFGNIIVMIKWLRKVDNLYQLYDNDGDDNENGGNYTL